MIAPFARCVSPSSANAIVRAEAVRFSILLEALDSERNRRDEKGRSSAPKRASNRTIAAVASSTSASVSVLRGRWLIEAMWGTTAE